MLALFPDINAAEFGPARLSAVKEYLMKTKGYVRKRINGHIDRIRRCWQWGSEHELVPAAVCGADQRRRRCRDGNLRHNGRPALGLRAGLASAGNGYRSPLRVDLILPHFLQNVWSKIARDCTLYIGARVRIAPKKMSGTLGIGGRPTALHNR